jgi:hypothetical protein
MITGLFHLVWKVISNTFMILVCYSLILLVIKPTSLWL